MIILIIIKQISNILKANHANDINTHKNFIQIMGALIIKVFEGN